MSQRTTQKKTTTDPPKKPARPARWLRVTNILNEAEPLRFYIAVLDRSGYSARMADVTQLMNAAGAGDPSAAAELLPLVYNALRDLAAARLATESPGQTLQPTALVHEAYLRLVQGHENQPWASLGHFFSAAAEAMRRILIEQARRRLTVKHGGAGRRVELSDTPAAPDQAPEDLLALDEALTELEQHDPTAARLVKLRYFAGLAHKDAADALGITRRAADRLWALARTWLYRRLADD
jgi:RNA polymerase sigma factor (TIGR02999 family)